MTDPIEFEDRLLALEQQVLTDAAGNFLIAVQELRNLLARGRSGIQQKLLRLAIPEVEALAQQGVSDGFEMGAAWALDTLHTVQKPVDDRTGRKAEQAVDTVPSGLREPLAGLDDLLRNAKLTAVLLNSSGADVQTVLSPIFGAATTTQARIETQINAASNTASRLVGEAVRSPMVWEAERDACVYCLGLAGKVVEVAGDEFPPADLYADGRTGQVTVSQPPLHPHCRCRLSILADRSYADALEREAQRSILRGFSLRSESQAVRIEAARRLLERDPVAPKSVKQYAAKAVKDGRFPRGRDVPAGDPRLKIT